MPRLVRMPAVVEPGLLGDLLEEVVQRIFGVSAAVLTREDEVIRLWTAVYRRVLAQVPLAD